MTAHRFDDYLTELEAVDYLRPDGHVCGLGCAHHAQPRLDARRRRAQPAPFPDHLERRYRKLLQARVRRQRRLLVTRLSKVLGRYRGKVGPRTDDVNDDFLRELLLEVTRVRAGYDILDPIPEEDLAALAMELDRYGTFQTLRRVGRVAGIDVRTTAADAIQSSWIRSQVELITSLDSKAFADIEEMLYRTVGEGISTKDLAKELSDRYDITLRRAELIAEDQVGNVNAEITRARQTGVGANQYRWSTSGDQRVRPTHRALDGTLQSWDDPPDIPGEGRLHPGEPIRCRCVAEAVFEGEVLPPEYEDQRDLDKAIRDSMRHWESARAA